MIEILLLIALGLNGWQFNDNGELSHSNKQLSQTVIEQSELLDRYYEKIGDYEAATIVAEQEIKDLYRESETQAVELEKLRNTDPSVDGYLREEIPMGLVGILQASSTDQVSGEDPTDK